MQTHLIIKASKPDASSTDDKLEELLKQGWKVIQTCPMPSSAGTTGKMYMPTCLVILEKGF